MTLCVAWKWEHQGEAKVCFAADTCVTFDKRRMELGGVKILAIPMYYSAPAEQGQGKRESWSRVYGLGFSGNYVAAFLVKELVAEILSDLQGAGGEEMTEFGRVCDLVGKFHAHFFNELERATAYPQDIDFVFGGFCPVAKKVRIARFYVDRIMRTTDYKEILQENGVSFDTLGCAPAGRRFRELMNLSLTGDPCRIHFAAFHRLRDIILSRRYPTVAGAIQYGEFESDGNFRLHGTGMLEMGPYGPAMKTIIRGTNLDRVHRPKTMDDFHIGGSSVLPFHEDVAQFEHDSHRTEDGQQTMLDEVITVLPWDRLWRAKYMAERRLLCLALQKCTGIEHIGSTAVANVPAVPVVDIMVAMRVVALGRAQRWALSRLGYKDLGWQRNGSVYCFRKRGKWSVNVFIVTRDCTFWRGGVALREYLYAHPGEAAAYGREKLRILNRGGWVLNRYNREKSAKVTELLQSAARVLEAMPKRKISWGERAAGALSWCRSWILLTPMEHLFSSD